MKQHVSLYTNFFQKKQDKDRLFNGIWLRWQVLTQAERVVCLGILLIPLWWVIGWGNILFLWVIGIAIYELGFYRKIRLSRPSLEVIAIIIFSFYTTISVVLNSPEIAPRTLIDPFFKWGCGGLLLWYIQSHQIRVRLEAIAWAFSVVICMMLVWWSFFRFILSEPYYTPPPTLYALILDKGAYDPWELGSVSNFLVPYYTNRIGFGGLARYTFFFPHPTVSSFAIGFMGLIALDLKNRLWSLPLVTACGFLILICQTRNAWLSLSIVLVIRWLFTFGNTQGLKILFILFAIISFMTLSIPSITDYINDNYNNTVETTSNFRKDSTEIRSLTYQRTWESFIEDPLLGHGINGASLLPGYEFGTIGTESFILGTLLYKSGLLGSGVFITFFTAFVARLYKTREDRPLCCFLMLLYLSIASLVTEFIGPEFSILLIIIMLCIPKQNQPLKSSAFNRSYT
jgi:O-Antigen ligase